MTTGRLVIVSAVLAVLAAGVAAAPAPDGVAVVIGNRTYANDRVPEVAYAHRDADAFRQYVVGMLGFDPDNIIDLRDATQAEMETTFGNERDHKGRLWSYLDPSGGSDVVVYYSGHGVPGLRDRKGYLLPSDANPDTAQLNGYPIDLLYENLGRMTEAASIRVFLDACFSGDSQAGMLIRSASPMFVSASLPDLSGKAMAVLTAASGDEVASWDERAEHGMFTHHLLDALYGAGDADRDGRVTVAETKRYLDRHLTRAARRAYLRDQTAGVGGDRTMVLASAPGGSFPKRPEVGRPAPPVQPFTVLTEPSDVRVRILNIVERYEPGMELPAGEYRVEASLEGHETVVEMVSHGSAGATEHQIALRRAAQPFTVLTEPGRARVRFVDIEDRYRPGMELTAGEYRVEASLEGYETIVEIVRHGSAGATEHQIALRRAAQPFTVLTEPGRARVRFVDIEDRYRPGMELPAGEYRVEASLEGYETIVEIVRHGSAGATQHRIALLRVAQPFTIVVDPAGAHVRFLDIEERYRSGMEMVAGEYRVEASLWGYETIVEIVRHGSEGATQHRIALRRVAQPFTVVTEPTDARVQILNMAERYRPGMELPAGEYRVEASLEGYETIVEIVRHGSAGETEHRIALAARRSAVERFRDCPDCPQMVVVPAGRFRMGCVSGQGCFDDEKPVRQVRIRRPFALSVHEVTFAEWDACVSAGGCGGYRPNDAGWGRENRPVMNVSWNDTRSYVSWLSRRTGKTYRLPSESEWEYAARAGSTTKYSWGNEVVRNRANCDGCGSLWDRQRTAPVVSFPANAFGLHDMHGNVWEWVEDCWNNSYARAPKHGGAWLSGECAARVLRGGSWNIEPRSLRAANRFRFTTGNRYYNSGFRVARTLAP